MKRSITLTEKEIRNFWKKVNKKGENECWTWSGFRNKKGYGQFKVGPAPRMAHRVSWVLHFGEIPEDLLVCHKCDNPPCVNPSHLFLGTEKDNQEDMSRKERSPRGEKQGSSVLKENDVIKIKSLLNNGLGPSEIAKMMNLNRRTVSSIKLGESWSWLK